MLIFMPQKKRTINNVTMISALKSQLTFAMAAAIIAATAMAAASTQFGLADGSKITLAMTVACALPMWAYASRSWATRGGLWALLAISAVVAGCSMYNIWDWTLHSGGTLAHPVLRADDSHYYEWALYHFDGSGQNLPVMFPGLPVLMMGLWSLLGVSVVWPMAMNAAFVLAAVVTAGAVARRVLEGRVSASGPAVAVVAMVMTGVLAYFVSQGIRIQKEAMVYLAIGLTGYALAGLRRSDSFTAADWWAYALACVILAFGRTTYLYFVIMGVAMMWAGNARRHWRTAAVLVAVAAALMAVGNHFAYYSVERHVIIVNGGNEMREAYINDGAQAPYLRLIGDYFNYPKLLRAAMLPLTLAVQFIIPFPWLKSAVVSVDTVLPRLAYGWYAVGAMAIFYFVAVSWRKRDNLGLWAWWLAASYAAIAYITAGSISRYVLPFEPLMATLATYVLCRAAEGRQRKALAGWLAAFAVVLGAALAVCSLVA